MKATLVASALLLSAVASAFPARRAAPRINLKLEISDDSGDEFTTQDIPFGQRFSTANNRQLSSGTSVSVNGADGVGPAAITCKAFGGNDQVLATFGENTVKFAQEPVPISAFDCELTSPSSSTTTSASSTTTSTSSTSTVTSSGVVLPPIGTGSNLGGFANIQLDIDPDTTIQQEIAIGVKVTTAEVPRLATGIDAILQGATGVVDPNAISCQAFDEADKPLGGPFTTEEEAVFGAQPVQIGAFLCQ